MSLEYLVLLVSLGHQALAQTTGMIYTTEPTERCPDDYEPIGSQCMKIFNEKVNWAYAKECCEIDSAKLVSLTSESDPMYLREYVGLFYPKASFWVGGKNYKFNGGWQWVSGVPVSEFFPWGINDVGVQQPTGPRQNCMILRYFPIMDDQQYVDNRCFKKNGFICEKPKIEN